MKVGVILGIVEVLSGNELMSIEKVIASLNLSGVILVCLSPFILIFISIIIIKHLKRVLQYKKKMALKESGNKVIQTEDMNLEFDREGNIVDGQERSSRAGNSNYKK